MRKAVLFLLLAVPMEAFGQPFSLTPPDARSNDPMYQEIKELVQSVSNCFIREAKNKALKKVDLNTAAYAVVGRCAAERQRFKAYSARNTLEHPPQFEARWRNVEADDLEFVKQVLAVVRTQ